MQPLVLHPSCDPGPIERVMAGIEATSEGCRARFRIEGDLPRVVLSPHAMAARTDGLWRTTCFEIFWQADGSDAYREFNLSPSSRWAAYQFDAHREGGRDAPVEALSIASSASDRALSLECSIAASLSLPASVALTAVIENVDGSIQFWAPSFADGKPDFHSARCRTIRLADPA